MLNQQISWRVNNQIALNHCIHSTFFSNSSCVIEYVSATSGLIYGQLIGNYKNIKMLFGKLNFALFALCFVRNWARRFHKYPDHNR